MLVLVAGGAGFIGSHLTDRLLADGHDVTVVDDMSRGVVANLAGALATGRCHLVTCDVTDPALVEVVARAQPEVVVNLAAQVDVRASVENPVADATTNVIGMVNLLEAARRCGARKVVLASSVAIYGAPKILPVTELSPDDPHSPYAAGKLAAEMYGRQFERLHGLATTTLVLGNVYGPRQDPSGEAGVVAVFAGAMCEGRPTRVFGDGSNVRDYVYVGDVVDALVRACGHAGGGLRLNIATGVGTTDLGLHRAVARAAGGAPGPVFAPPRLGDVPRMVADADRARVVFDWVPRVSLVEGIGRTLDAEARSVAGGGKV